MKRDPNRWLWILVFGSMWVVAIFTPWQHLPLTECPIKSILGFPCPTCGGIRAILALKEFHILKAFKMNPLVIMGLFIIGIWGWLLLLLPHFPTPDRSQKLVRYFSIGGAIFSMAYLFVKGI
jgi:hypothetical protein